MITMDFHANSGSLTHICPEPVVESHPFIILKPILGII